MPVRPALVLAALLAVTAGPALAQPAETADVRRWDQRDDWRRRAEAEREAMQAVAELFAPAVDATAGPAPAERRPRQPAPRPEPPREPPPGDPSLFFE